MEITLSAYTPRPAVESDSDSGVLRMYYSETLESDGVMVVGSPVFSEAFFAQAEWEVDEPTGLLTVASSTIYSTINSNRPDATLTAVLYDANGNQIQPAPLWSFRIPNSLGATITYEELVQYNDAEQPQIPPDVGVLNADQTDSIIQSALGSRSYADTDTLGLVFTSVTPAIADEPIAVGDNDPRMDGLPIVDASAADKGITRLSLNPVSATEPIAVGDNDPRLSTSSSSYASLAAAVTAIGSTPTELLITNAFPSGSSCTVPSTLLLTFQPGGSIVLGSGHTIIIRSGMAQWPIAQIFSGTGTVNFSGSERFGDLHPEWWGAIADESTDCTAAIQKAIDCADTTNLDATISFVSGIYIVAGALQDTGASNSQLVLPKRADGSQMTLRFLGVTPESTEPFSLNVGGSILRSTLASGNGAVIGVKGGMSVPVSGTTNLAFHLENMAIQTIPNPTISGIDLSYIPNYVLHNSQVSTSQAINFPGTNITEPTTTTSYGIKGRLNGVGDVGIFDNVVVYGFYNGVRLAELDDARRLVVPYCVWAIEIPEAWHLITGDYIGIYNCKNSVKFTGAQSYVDLNLDIEHDNNPAWASWATPNTDISDPSNFGHGNITWMVNDANETPIGPSATRFYVTGAAGIQFHNTMRGYSNVGPTSEIFTGFRAQDNAVYEINRGLPTANVNNNAWLVLVTNQTDVNGAVGHVTAYNPASGKRVGQIEFVNDGATDQGGYGLYTADSSGDLQLGLGVNHYQVATSPVLFAQSEGAVLAISSNIITPTNAVHHINDAGGLIKTITLPSGFVSGTIYLIAGVTPPTVDTSGNCGRAVSTWAAGQMIAWTYSSSTSKWYPSL